MSADILARLEAVAARLESYAHAVASGSVSSSSSGAAASGGVPREVEDYDQFYNEHVVPFVNAAKKSKETEAIGGWAERAWGFVRTVIFASKQSKKPADAALAKFVEPLSAVISETQKPNRTIPANHAKAFGDAVVSTSWFTQGGNARAFAQDQLEQADFWLIKILKEGKDSGKADFTEFAQKLKVLLQKQVEFIGDNYRAGLEWNPKGADLSAFSGAGAPAAAAPAPTSGAPAPPPGPPGDYFAPDAPPGPPPPGDYSSSAPAKPSTAAGLGAVFAELTSKGDGVTKGLTKVTKDMKNALKAAPVLEAKKKEDVAPAKKWGATAAKVEEKKEPRLHLAKGTWFCEHYENTEVTIPDVELKENVYILKCKNTTISIPNKCKSIQVDGSVKTHVQFKSVVSLAEIFNSQRVVLDCIETLPSVAVDKSQGCQIWLSRQGVAAPPEIITSSVSELNLQVPGKTDEDDPIEIALPEQYITKYKGGTTLVTEPVTHGSNG